MRMQLTSFHEKRFVAGRSILHYVLPLLFAVMMFLVVQRTSHALGNSMTFEHIVAPPPDSPEVPAPVFKTSATLCPVQPLEQLKQARLLHSQLKEDENLLHWFNGLCGGTYMELGALDGDYYSNSYVFRHALNWKGVLIELGPNHYARLIKNRPDELAVVNAGVCATNRTVHYVERDSVGGILEFSSKKFQDTWWRKHVSEAQPIPCQPLQTILDAVADRFPNSYSNHDQASGPQFWFDFLSLDVEGSEVEALQSVDWRRTGFGVIVVEANVQYFGLRKIMAVRTLLERNGYTFVYVPSDTRNFWFVNHNFDMVYGDFLNDGEAARDMTNTTL